MNVLSIYRKTRTILKNPIFSRAQKINLVFNLLKLLVAASVYKRKKVIKFKICSYVVFSFSYHNLLVLFNEIFIRSNYYFKSEKEDPIIFDCGANIGLASIFFKLIYPKCTIYAFEPDKQTFGLLKENIRGNNIEDIVLINKALTDFNGNISFYSDKNNPGGLGMSLYYERCPYDEIQVECTRLSDFIKEDSVDFMKIDVEGAEIHIINDLDATKKWNKIKQLNIEYHHRIGNAKSKLGEFLAILEKNNFEYQINTQFNNLYHKRGFQDIQIYLYKII